ncbi:flagellar hook-length control protein FliK [Bordetella holmesii]|uniref:Flagellar hook-length control protein FliK n=3 Tax=Bordetella holmesii TaxID=35814 RepID=A0A158M2K4_9BORD|nr:flagellar hook-length control protein FliK [Bordetella holmesii]AHV93211.1 flagellar hook-length control FliK family protein [Bordetella holmesii ATCC 51541]AIT28143.1 flagellar hook-length control FliK family protein [Bordetella holmesii 44057]AMD46849.1 flagellar hook-length control protein [Bordetella holmesii H558]AMD47765.1 flagellar hook-length control protein [Bordetella holmesii F627]EWM40929.1 flagellar hook-length control FliK family protein [Bordetella holmesii 35009]EXX94152.1 
MMMNPPSLALTIPTVAPSAAPAGVPAPTTGDDSDSFARVLNAQKASGSDQAASVTRPRNNDRPQAMPSDRADTAPACASRPAAQDDDTSDSPHAGSTQDNSDIAAALGQGALPLPAAPALPQQTLELAAQVAEVQARVAAANTASSEGADTQIEHTLAARTLGATAAEPAAAAKPAATRMPSHAKGSSDDEQQGAQDVAAVRPVPNMALTAEAVSPVQPRPQAQTSSKPPAPETSPAAPLHAVTDAAQAWAELSPARLPVATATADVTTGLQLSSPVGATQWGQELSRQVVIFSENLAQGSHTAQLRLDPPDLGPLRVTLSINDGVASASFVSAHAAVRQAVETALPQLQQALSQAGISLGHTNVGDQGTPAMAGQAGGQSSGQPGHHGQAKDGRQALGAVVIESAAALRTQAHEGLVNTYA